RAAARERAVVADRRVGMTRPRVDENLALRIGADAANLADEHVLRRLQQVGVAVERNARYCVLGRKRSGERERHAGGDEETQTPSLHSSLRERATAWQAQVTCH